jgi:hypothetical protein
MRDALSLFDRVYAFAGESLTLDAARKALGIPAETLFDDLLRQISAHDSGGCLATLNAVYEDGLEVSEVLTGFGEYLRDLLFARQPGVTPALLGLGESRFADLRKLAGDLQDGDILRYAKIVSDLIAGLKFAPHPRLWVELGLARMAALDRVVTLSQLMGQDVTGAVALQPAVPPAATPDEKKKSPELTPRTGQHAEDPAPHPRKSIDSKEMYGRLAESPVEPDDSRRLGESPVEPHGEHQRLAESPEEVLLPPSVLITPNEAPARWPDLVEDFALDRPFTSSPLRHSQLVLKTHAEGEPAALDVVFANEHHYDLFLADGDNRKSLRAFLASRFGAGTVFALTYTAVTSAEASANGSSVRSIHPAESAEAIIQSEPVIQTLIQMFEGRVLN